MTRPAKNSHANSSPAPLQPGAAKEIKKHKSLSEYGSQLNLVLLDRDGVINVESEQFIKSPEEWTALPGAISAIASLQQTFRVAVCTNQSGLGRNLFSVHELDAIHAKFQQALVRQGARPIDIFFCPHTPDQHCECRKPQPGLLTLAMQHVNTTPERTLFVGDSARDIHAGLAAGCHVALVHTGNGKQTSAQMPEVNAYRDLSALAQVLTAID